MNRIEKKFGQLKKEKRKAFIAFITAGYPDLGATGKLILEFGRIGVDIVELGVPFSDPMADGPVIQEASQHALKRKTHLIDILKLVKRARKNTDIPICLMTYYNPVFCFGDKAFAKAARVCGVDGVIIPDLPPEEGAGLLSACAKNKVDVISFISPTTSRERMKKIAKSARGFIYYVSLTGTTGARTSLPKLCSFALFRSRLRCE
ncbi:tryptophan synthase subunit alpha [bacterium]|nr:MAG: tryptophan synthase subunit alpha [bacterium]